MAEYFRSLRLGTWLYDQRIRRIAICSAILFPIGFAIEIWLHIHLRPTPSSLVNFPLGEDFLNFWAGAKLALQGHAVQVFDLKAFLDFEHRIGPPFTQFRWYAYPPIALMLSSPFGIFPYLPSYVIWLIAGGFICSSLLARTLNWPVAIVVATLTPAAFVNAVSGQNGAFTAAIIAGSIMQMEKRPLLAGALISLLIFKPQLAILFPVALIAGKQWKALAAATIAVFALFFASVWLLGIDTWVAYLQVAPLNRLILEQGTLPDFDSIRQTHIPFWHRMPTIFSAGRQLGASANLSYVAQAISAAAATTITWLGWRSNGDISRKGAILILATLMFTPYAWDYDLIMLSFAVVWLWLDGAKSGWLPYEKTVLACMFGGTLFFATISRITHVPFEQALIWASLLLAARRASIHRQDCRGDVSRAFSNAWQLALKLSENRFLLRSRMWR